MLNYKNPAEMFGMTPEDWQKQPREVKIKQWNSFMLHIKERGFMGLFEAYQQEKAEREEIVGKYSNCEYLKWR